MNGAVSGVREGIIMDRILSIADEHEHETLNWIVREKGWGEFSQAGDSGAGFGLEGGEAGGLILQGRVGLADDGQRFPFSIVSSLEDVLSRIREITGRRLILHVLGRDPPSPGPSRNRWTHRGTAPVSESRSRPSAPESKSSNPKGPRQRSRSPRTRLAGGAQRVGRRDQRARREAADEKK
jgi:hypothetical protein